MKHSAQRLALAAIVTVAVGLIGCSGAGTRSVPATSGTAAYRLATAGVTLASCVYTAPSGGTYWNGKSANTAIANTPQLENLAIADANLGIAQQIQTTITSPLPDPFPSGGGGALTQPGAWIAYNDPSNSVDASTNGSTIYLTSGAIDYDTQYRQMTFPQILFAEYDIEYYMATGALTGLPNTVSASFNGRTFFWTLNAPNATVGLYNLLADDDLKATFGEDQGGAIWRALRYSDNPPTLDNLTQAWSTAFMNVRPTFNFTRASAPPSAPQTCSN